MVLEGALRCLTARDNVEKIPDAQLCAMVVHHVWGKLTLGSPEDWTLDELINRFETRCAWVSTEQRLPADFQTVIGWITGPLDVAQEPFADCVTYDATRKAWRYSLGDHDTFVNVTHWMPKPNKPA